MVSDKKRWRKILMLIFIALILLTLILFDKFSGVMSRVEINTYLKLNTKRLLTFILIRLPSSSKVSPDNLSQEIISDFVARNEGLRLIIIDKTIRKLYLYENDQLVTGFPVPIALGFDPVNKKERSGDGRTPEGEYSIYNKHPSRSYKYFLEINYPNELDVERGLRDGLITPAEGRRILRGLETFDGGIRGTNLGDAIGIHTRRGDDNRPITLRNWTLGCIALERDDMFRVYQGARIGDKVLIIGKTYKNDYRSNRDSS